VARRYAGAVFSLARDRGVVDEVEADLERLVRAVGRTPALRALLDHRLITPEEKHRVFSELPGLDLAPLTLRFLRVLFHKRRERFLADIHHWYTTYADEARGVTVARVRSAAELSEGFRERLREELERLVGGRIKLDCEVDPGLMGGLRVQLGDRVLDGSLARRLQQLRARLSPEKGAS